MAAVAAPSERYKTHTACFCSSNHISFDQKRLTSCRAAEPTTSRKTERLPELILRSALPESESVGIINPLPGIAFCSLSLSLFFSLTLWHKQRLVCDGALRVSCHVFVALWTSNRSILSKSLRTNKHPNPVESRCTGPFQVQFRFLAPD